MEINMINHKNEENILYKCHFCQQNIDVYDIRKHFSMFHKFRDSFESEYVCEFCDEFEEFESQTNLFHHIQDTHNLTNDKEIKSEAITYVNTLEEGKSRFLQFIVNFNSQDDVFNLLQWIKFNDANILMTNHQKFENQFQTVGEKISKSIEEDHEKILHDNMDNTDSYSEYNQENDLIFTQRDINTIETENQVIETDMKL